MDRTGTSLAEVASTLLLLALLAGIAFPPLRAWSDRIAVRSAREEAVALFALARRGAPGGGGAVVRLEPSAGRGTVLLGAQEARQVNFAERFGVRLEAGDAERVEIRYDPLGLGRVASRTVRFRKGGAEVGLVVSAYGRVRRR